MRLQFEELRLNIVAFLGTNFEGSLVILMKMMDTSLKSAHEQAVADPGGFEVSTETPFWNLYTYSIKRLLREEYKIDDLFFVFFWSSTQTGLG